MNENNGNYIKITVIRTLNIQENIKILCVLKIKIFY